MSSVTKLSLRALLGGGPKVEEDDHYDELGHDDEPGPSTLDLRIAAVFCILFIFKDPAHPATRVLRAFSGGVILALYPELGHPFRIIGTFATRYHTPLATARFLLPERKRVATGQGSKKGGNRASGKKGNDPSLILPNGDPTDELTKAAVAAETSVATPSQMAGSYTSEVPTPKLHQFGYVKWQWSPSNEQLSRVPQVTLVFWVVKCLCTALGETLADQMNISFGEDNYSQGKALAVYGMILFFFLCLQFWLRSYLAPVTDIMADIDGVQHNVTTAIFASLLGATFVVWYIVESTLSIHSIFSARREMFYWIVVFFTFVLGTSTGDQLAEDDQLGYWRVLCIVLGIILGVYALFVALSLMFKEKLPQWVGILCFWIAYVLTRPLGASVGDLLTAPKGNAYALDTCAWVGASEEDTGCDTDICCITPYYLSTFECNTCSPPPPSPAFPPNPRHPHSPPPPHNSHPPPLAGRHLLQDAAAADYAPAAPDCWDICGANWTDAFCPEGPYPNPCDAGVSTCYTPLACEHCWGLDGLTATNIAFGVAIFVLVVYLTWSGIDKIPPPGKNETPPTFWQRVCLLLGLRISRMGDKQAAIIDAGDSHATTDMEAPPRRHSSQHLDPHDLKLTSAGLMLLLEPPPPVYCSPVEIAALVK
eukprot:gene14537-20576_t